MKSITNFLASTAILKRAMVWCITLATAALTACSYDDGDLWKSVNDLDDRVTTLESQVKDLNTNYTSLSQLIKALEQKVTIESVAELPDNGGYVITLTDKTKLTLTNGKDGAKGEQGEAGKDGANAPVIGIALDTTDGVYYWTMTTGDTTTWLLDIQGKKMPVSGTTPMIGVDANGYWTVSYDRGTTYTLLLDAAGQPIAAKADTTLLKSITTDAGYVYITLNDAANTVIKIALDNTFSLTIKGTEAINEFAFGETRVFDVESTGVTKVVITKPDEWQANLTDGRLTITAPTEEHAACAELAGEVALIYFNTNSRSNVTTLNVAVAPKQQEAANASIAIPTDFSASNILKATVNGVKVAEICLEFVRTADGSTAKQMTVVYPVVNGVTDLTKGIDAGTGGSVAWNTADNTVTYTAGAGAVTTVYVDAQGQLSTTAPEGEAAPATVEAEILRDVRGTEIQEYALTKIGTQYWMAQSLRAEYYTDGTAISKTWDNADGAYTVLFDDPLNAATYGRLYSGRTVFNAKLAPEGWAVCTADDVTRLKNYMGTATVGTKLKSTTEWTANVGNNWTGFNALPGMFYNPAQSGETWGGNVPDVYFWTATEVKDPLASKVKSAAFFRLYNGNTRLTFDPNPSNFTVTTHSLDFGHYVRCVRK